MGEKEEVLEGVEEVGRRLAEVRGRIRGIRKKTRRALIRPLGDGFIERVNKKVDGIEARLNERINERRQIKTNRRQPRDVEFRLRSGDQRPQHQENPTPEQDETPCFKCGYPKIAGTPFCPKCGTDLTGVAHVQPTLKKGFYV